MRLLLVLLLLLPLNFHGLQYYDCLSQYFFTSIAFVVVTTPASATVLQLLALLLLCSAQQACRVCVKWHDQHAAHRFRGGGGVLEHQQSQQQDHSH